MTAERRTSMKRTTESMPVKPHINDYLGREIQIREAGKIYSGNISRIEITTGTKANQKDMEYVNIYSTRNGEELPRPFISFVYVGSLLIDQNTHITSYHIGDGMELDILPEQIKR